MPELLKELGVFRSSNCAETVDVQPFEQVWKLGSDCRLQELTSSPAEDDKSDELYNGHIKTNRPFHERLPQCDELSSVSGETVNLTLEFRHYGLQNGGTRPFAIDTITHLPLTVVKRKEIVLQSTPPTVMRQMEDWVASQMDLLKPDREPDECWLHPQPPNSNNTIKKSFGWHDGRCTRELFLNLGVVTLFLAQTITDEQMQGYIYHGWHLSHLCGNWTCCNFNHVTIEPGWLNSARNACFKTEDVRCAHDPPCMRALKRPLHELRPHLFVGFDLLHK